jgi:signal transduction histidine kinase
LSGMKERTERIGGELRVLSRAEAGTEVELSVPSRVAFEARKDERGARLLSKLIRGKKGDIKSPN